MTYFWGVLLRAYKEFEGRVGTLTTGKGNKAHHIRLTVEIMLGNHPEIAIEFSAQTTLPITFFLKGNLVNLVENDEKFGSVEIMQTFYARCVQQELILSTNLMDWKPFLEFITGNALVSLSIQDGKPSIVVGAETNQRS